MHLVFFHFLLVCCQILVFHNFILLLFQNGRNDEHYNEDALQLIMFSTFVLQKLQITFFPSKSITDQYPKKYFKMKNRFRQLHCIIKYHRRCLSFFLEIWRCFFSNNLVKKEFDFIFSWLWRYSIFACPFSFWLFVS